MRISDWSSDVCSSDLLNLNHAKWQEAVINLLHVMERPCTINGHRVSVKTEAEFGRRWGKKMTPWNRDPATLASVAAQALVQTRSDERSVGNDGVISVGQRRYRYHSSKEKFNDMIAINDNC